jgi:hypothetical protein
MYWSGLTKTAPRPGPDRGLGLWAVRSPQYLKTGPDRLVWSSVFVKSRKTGPDRTTGSLTATSFTSKSVQSLNSVMIHARISKYMRIHLHSSFTDLPATSTSFVNTDLYLPFVSFFFTTSTSFCASLIGRSMMHGFMLLCTAS